MDDFAARYGPWAVIAGGSEGIGAAYARRIAERGVNVAVVARRPAPIEELAERIRATTGVQVRGAAVDLTSPSLLDDVAGVADGIEVGLLVYNAGAVHGAAFFVDRPLRDA